MLIRPVFSMLQTGEIDLAILHAPFQRDDGLEIRKIGDIHECFVTGSRFQHLTQCTRSLEELSRYPFITVLEGAATNRFLSQMFAQQGLTLEADMEVTTIELVVKAVLHNFGIAMLPREHIESYLQSGQLYEIPVETSSMVRTACVLTHQAIPLRPAARVFLERYLLH